MSYVTLSFAPNEILTSGKMNQVSANFAALVDGTALANNALVSRHYSTNSIPTSALPLGAPVQIVQTDFSNMLASPSIIPYDDTPPQIGEGFEVMTQSITPTNANNILLVEAVIYGSINGPGASEFIGAIFRDAIANSLGANSVTISGAGYLEVITVRAKVVAGSISPTTFRVRIGCTDGRNVSFNGYASGTGGVGTRVFNTTGKSSLRVTEVKA